TILYTCRTTFKNTNKLISTVLLSAKSSNNCYNNSPLPQLAKSLIKYDNNESNDYENSIDLDNNIVISEEKEKDQAIKKRKVKAFKRKMIE
ncbi:32847_t:CDS:1, partial [Racocetra persica]